MTARVLLQKASRAQWLRARGRGIGGTDAAAILGHHKWSTPLDVWLSKTGRAEPTPSSYPMARGNALEAFLLAEYGRQTGAIIERPPALLAHPDHPELVASLDGLAHHRDRTVVVDAKTVGHRGAGVWWDEERMCPDMYAVQMLHYLAVTGLEEAVLVADVAGDYTEVAIARDRAWEAAALPLLVRWWAEHVVADTPPPADWERDSIPALNRAWVTEPGETVEADLSTAAAVHACVDRARIEAQVKRDKDSLRVLIRERMGTAQVLTIGGEKAAALDSRGVLRVKEPRVGDADPGSVEG